MIIKFCLVFPKIFLLHKVVRDAKKVEKHCARELFKRSKDSACLVVYNEEKCLFVLGFRFFVRDIISGVLLGQFGPLYLALGPIDWW